MFSKSAVEFSTNIAFASDFQAKLLGSLSFDDVLVISGHADKMACVRVLGAIWALWSGYYVTVSSRVSVTM